MFFGAWIFGLLARMSSRAKYFEWGGGGFGFTAILFRFIVVFRNSRTVADEKLLALDLDTQLRFLRKIDQLT